MFVFLLSEISQTQLTIMVDYSRFAPTVNARFLVAAKSGTAYLI
jgi:hypothetical protein